MSRLPAAWPATDIIRNARLGIIVRPRPTVVVKLQADFAAVGRTASDSNVAGFALTDACVQLAPDDTARWRRVHPALVVGQFKQPFGLEAEREGQSQRPGAGHRSDDGAAATRPRHRAKVGSEGSDVTELVGQLLVYV